MKTVRFTALAALLLLAALPLRAQNEQTEKKEAQSAADAAAAAAAAFAKTEVPQAAPPKPVYWKKAATTSLGFSQQKLSNWAAGGVNNVTLNAALRGNANFANGKTFEAFQFICSKTGAYKLQVSCPGGGEACARAVLSLVKQYSEAEMPK